MRKTGMGVKETRGSLDGPKKSERRRRLEISKDKGAKVLENHLLEILLLFCGNFLALYPSKSSPHCSQGLRVFLAFPFSLFLIPCPHLVHPPQCPSPSPLQVQIRTLLASLHTLTFTWLYMCAHTFCSVTCTPKSLR